MPQLQVALDQITLEDALALMKQLEPLVDIVEVGTPLVLEYGLQAVRTLKERWPRLEILCDGKIMDAGAEEAESMFRAGADWVTVMGVTDRATIVECVSAAANWGGRVMADMLCVSDVADTVAFLEEAGVDCIAVHTGVDQQRRGKTALDDLRCLKAHVRKSAIAVAGGITLENVDRYLALRPDILIVGGGILAQPSPVEAALSLRRKLISGLL